MTRKGAQNPAAPGNDFTDENYVYTKCVCEILFQASGQCLKKMEKHSFRKMYFSH